MIKNLTFSNSQLLLSHTVASQIGEVAENR